LVPGTVVAMMVFGVTTIFLSSSDLPWTLYFNRQHLAVDA